MTEAGVLCAAYNIGIAQDDDLEIIGDAARRLAAVTVPLLCGTTDYEDLLTLLDSFSLISHHLQRHSQVQHYVQRIYIYLKKKPNKILKEKLFELFPEIPTNTRQSRAEPETVPASRPSRAQHVQGPASRPSRAQHVPGPDVFQLNEDVEDVQCALLTMADLRDSLPFVACEMASYEAAWRGAQGSTATALALQLDTSYTIRRPTLGSDDASDTSSVIEVKPRRTVSVKRNKPRTGREVVDYVLSGMLTEQTYIAYLNKPIANNPYHLVVVPKSKLNREHFIISSFGVLHVVPNGENEVYSLSKWLRNAQVYDHIITIPFFRHYTLLRQFLRWRYNAVLARYQRHRAIIKNELLHSIPTFGSNMIQIQGLLCEIMKIPGSSMDELLPGTLVNFSETVQKQHQVLIKYLTRFLQFHKQLTTAAQQYLLSQLKDAEFNNRPSPDYLTNPISVQKKKKQKRMEHHKQCRNDYNKVENYNNLMDLQVQFLLVNYIAEATIHLVKRIKWFVNDEHSSLVTINLVYSLEEGKDIIMSYPSLNDVENTLSTLLKDISASVLQCGQEWLPDNKLLQEEKIFQLLSYNTEYSTVVEEFSTFLLMAVEEVRDYCKGKEWLCEIRSFVRQWQNVDEYKGKSASVIESVLEKVSAWSADVESLITEFDTKNHILHVTCSALYSALQPALEDISTSLINMVIAEFETRGANLIEHTKDKHQMLKSQKAEVSSFAQYAKTLNSVKQSSDLLLAEKVYIKSLFGILQKLKSHCGPMINEIDKRLHLQWELYLMVLHDGETFINKEAPSMLEGLEEQIKTLEIEAELVLRKISQSDSPYCDPGSEKTEMVAASKEAFDKILDLRATMLEFSDWKYSITGNYHNMMKMQSVRDKVEGRYEVWKTLQTVINTVNEWRSTPFVKFSPEAASHELDEWNCTIHNLSNILPDKDSILKRLESEVHNVAKFLPLLTLLSSESVKMYHWQEICICMGEMFDPKKTLFLSDLLTSALLIHSEMISRICGQALTEHTLELNMTEMEHYWENREFHLKKISVPKRNTNRKNGDESVFILDPEDDIVQQIDEHQVLLQSIVVSPYVRELHARAEAWLVLLQQLHVIMHIWPICHTNWMFLNKAYVSGSLLEDECLHLLIESDRDFRQLLIVVWEDPCIMSLFGRKSLGNIREMQGDKLILRLETLQKNQEYLMPKIENMAQITREKFPRLYFVSEDDLMTALTTSDTLQTAKYITSACLPNIVDITIQPRMDEKDPQKITQICGVGDEIVPLLYPVKLSQHLTQWLSELQGVVIKTLNNMMYYSLMSVEHSNINCGGHLKVLLGDINVKVDTYSESGMHKEYLQNEGSLHTWLSDYPLQCILTSQNVAFTLMLRRWLDKNIKFGTLSSWIQNCQHNLLSTLRELHHRYPLTKRKNVAIQALVLQCLAQRDRTNNLRSLDIVTWSSFPVLTIPKFTVTPHSGRYDWVSALPSTHTTTTPTVEVTVEQLTAKMTYDYEYIGPFSRIVITPTTERVELSLVSAVSLQQTLIITGPSNCGKFETIKDYCNVLGRYCVEFSDTLRPLLLTHLLAGLVQTGVWVVVRMNRRSDLLCELGHRLKEIHRGLSALVQGKSNIKYDSSALHSEAVLTRPSSNAGKVKIRDEETVLRSESVCSEIKPICYIPSYLGNIMIGEMLVPASGSFQSIITLPPSQTIPSNLLSSCRNVAMIAPYLPDIILAKLLSAGYKHYTQLASSLNCFLTYLNAMMDKMSLYSLSTIKGILLQATVSLITDEWNSETLSSISISSVEETMTLIEEERLLIEAIVGALTPAFTIPQRGLMKQVLQEVFPLSVSHVYNIAVPSKVRSMVTEQFESNKLEVVPAMLEKTLELYHVIQNRKCVVLAGPVGCGKTTMFSMLSNAINFMQATESRHKPDMRQLKDDTPNYPATPTSKYGTPLPDQSPRETNSSKNPSRTGLSVGGSRPNTDTRRRASYRSEKLRGIIGKSNAPSVTPNKNLNILPKPETGSQSSRDNDRDSNRVRIFRLFINTLTFQEFVGSGTVSSQDGIFINLCRKFGIRSPDSNGIQNWVLLDGNIKPYMESLLSTAINNKVISALNGSQIRIKQNVQFFIESDTLKDLSPSFIAKCGIVVMNNSIVGWRQRFRSWLKGAEKEFYLTKSRVFTLTVLMETFIGQMLQYLDIHAGYIMMPDKHHTQAVSSLLRWLDVLFARFITSPSKNIDKELYLNTITILIFLKAYIWAFGANLLSSSVPGYSEFVKNQIFDSNHVINCPDSGSVFDWCINDKELRFDLWSQHFSDLKPQSSVLFTSTLLHERTLYLTELLQSSGVPVAVVGSSGCGKSAFVQNSILPKLHPTKIKITHLTTMRGLEDNIENKMVLFQRRQQAMASPTLPSFLLEDFNTVPNTGQKTGLQEVLRKVLAKGETYSFKRKVFRNLGAAHFILTCSSPISIGAGSDLAIGEIVERLLHYFNILPIHYPEEDEWVSIFFPIVNSWLGDFPTYKLGFKTLIATAIVGATCQLYQVIRETFKACPVNSHFIFDGHSLSQVFQGIFLMSPTSKFRQMRKSVKAGGQRDATRRDGNTVIRQKSVRNDRIVIRGLVQLWVHETHRVFVDRIGRDEDRSEMYRYITDIMKQHFCSIVWSEGQDIKERSHEICEKFSKNLSLNMKKYITSSLEENLDEMERGSPLIEQDDMMSSLPHFASDLIFTRNLVYDGDCYQEEGLSSVMERLDEMMKSDKLVSFSRSAKHCVRLSRSIMLTGHSILLGPPGSGRKVVAKVTASAHNYTFMCCKDDVNKTLCKALIAAGSGTQGVLLFIEGEPTTENYADLAFFISEGYHPDLINIGDVNTSYGNANMEVFYKRAYSNLHIVLSLSAENGHLSPALIQLFTTYPVLVKKCTCLDSYTLWPIETLAEIATFYLDTHNKMLSKMAANVHLCALEEGTKSLSNVSSFVNPASFLDLLNLYKVMGARIKTSIQNKLVLLNEVFEKVNAVEDVLKEKRSKKGGLEPVLSTAQIVHQGWVDEIKKEKAQYYHSYEKCKEEEAHIENKKKDLENLIHLNDLDRNEVSPLLELAVQALDSIKKDSIQELKSYKNPPALVLFVLEPFCILFDRDIGWDSALHLLQEMDLLLNMCTLKKDRIKNKTLKHIKSYLDDPRFDIIAVEKVSTAAKSVCIYLTNVYKYSTMIKCLRPKQRQVEEITTDLENSQRDLGHKWLELSELKVSLDHKMCHHETTLGQIKEIQFRIKGLNKEIESAELLLSILSDKVNEWTLQNEDLKQAQSMADGDAMLAAGAIVYFGPFSLNSRMKLMEAWKEGIVGQSFITEGILPRSPSFDIITTLSSQTELLSFKKKGLPKDTFSLQNVLITRELYQHSTRQIIISDTDQQFPKWANILKPGPDKITRWESSSEIIVNTVQSSGQLSEDRVFSSECDEINISSVVYYDAQDERLSDKLTNAHYKLTNRLTIIRGVGEHGVAIPSIDQTERVIMLTELTVEEFSHYTLNNCVIIEYSLSEEGMTESLLNLILEKECCHVQNKECSYSKTKLKKTINIQDCEITLLQYIVNYSHCLLQSNEIIPLVKSTSETVKNENLALADSDVKSNQLMNKIEQYKALALHGSTIAKVLIKLNGLSLFYNFSLGHVTIALGHILDHSSAPVSSGTNARVNELKTLLHVAIYEELALSMHQRSSINQDYSSPTNHSTLHISREFVY